MLKRFKSFKESNFIKNPHDLIVGDKYKITHPVYDDFDEGLEADVDIVIIDKKLRNSYVATDIKYIQQYELKFDYLMSCEIEKL